jgi:hypothetical protein
LETPVTKGANGTEEDEDDALLGGKNVEYEETLDEGVDVADTRE